MIACKSNVRVVRINKEFIRLVGNSSPNFIARETHCVQCLLFRWMIQIARRSDPILGPGERELQSLLWSL